MLSLKFFASREKKTGEPVLTFALFALRFFHYFSVCGHFFPAAPAVILGESTKIHTRTIYAPVPRTYVCAGIKRAELVVRNLPPPRALWSI